MGPITSFMIVLACWHGDVNRCRWLVTFDMTSRYRCSLKRPSVSSIYQKAIDPGWFIFTRCVLKQKLQQPNLELVPRG